MKLRLKLDVDKCVACSACVVACMDQNDIDTDIMSSFRRFADYETDGTYTYISVSCMHCDDAPCVIGCPAGCLRKDSLTDLTLYDNTNCIGCRSCSMACPVGAPSFLNDKLVKCDGCIVRMENGMMPACTLVCPTGALKMIDEDTGKEVVLPIPRNEHA